MPGSQGTPEFVVAQDLFVRVNGVRLHFLDWGGEGDLMLFLPGLTATAHMFNQIAPAFAPRCHVMGLTRRGHGASEAPETGYDLETLVADVVAFIDAIGADRVVLVGQSFAGIEVPLVAAQMPSRIAAVVLLDAVYDWPANATLFNDVIDLWETPESAHASRQALEEYHRRRYPNQWGQPLLVHLRSKAYITANGTVAWQLPLTGEPFGQLVQTLLTGTDYSGIQAPVLAIWANQTEPETENLLASGYSEADVARFREWASITEAQNKQRGLELLRQSVAGAVVVEVQAPHEMVWYAPEEVIRIMNEFLGLHIQ